MRRLGGALLVILAVMAGAWPTALAAGPVHLTMSADPGPHLVGSTVVIVVRATDDAGGPVPGLTVDLSPFGLRAATNPEGEAWFSVSDNDVERVVVRAASGSSGATAAVTWSTPRVTLPAALEGTIGTPVLVHGRLSWAHDDRAIAQARGGLFNGPILVAASSTASDGTLAFSLESDDEGTTTYALAFDQPWLTSARGTLAVTWRVPERPPPPPSPTPTPTPTPPSPTASTPDRNATTTPTPSSSTPTSPTKVPTSTSVPTPSPTPPSPTPTPSASTPGPSTLSTTPPTAPTNTTEPVQFVREVVSAEQPNATLVRAGTQLMLDLPDSRVPVREERRTATPAPDPAAHAASLGRAGEGWTLIRSTITAGASVAQVSGATSWWIEGNDIVILASDRKEIEILFVKPPVDLREAPWTILWGISWTPPTLVLFAAIPIARRLAAALARA